MKTHKNKGKELDETKQMYYNKKRNKVIQKKCGCHLQSQKIGGDVNGNITCYIYTYFFILHYSNNSNFIHLKFSYKTIFKLIYNFIL